MDSLNNGAWCDTEPGDHMLDNGLVPELAKLFTACSVADFGCGYGYYVDALIERGISAVGFDGDPGSPKSKADLSIPFVYPCDWVLSLEVGEHIPPECEQVFIDNLCQNASIGLVLSWAFPGQRGRGHVNERDTKYIRDEVTRRGFVVDSGATMRLKLAADIWYFKRTITVFRKVFYA